MEQGQIKFSFKAFESLQQLPEQERSLVMVARDSLRDAYAPYSNFRVAAAILLANGKTVTGTNQENAALPAGICAEGTALSTASSLYPGVAPIAIAITAKSGNGTVTKPVVPCGICRQRLVECESRFAQPVKVILAGETGQAYVIDSAADLLPMHFSKGDL